MPYDPNSTDAMFGKVMTRLDQQDTTLNAILTEVKKTNGRVTKLETENAVTNGKIAVISSLVVGAAASAGWAFTHFFQ